MAKKIRFVAPDPEHVRRAFSDSGFVEMKRENGNREISFCRRASDPTLLVVVYTTIDGEGIGEAGRACGEDAGRVVILWARTGRPVWSAKKVLRTKSFLVNLVMRANEAVVAASGLKRCSECGAPMVKRESKAGHEFYGCAAYPACRATMPA